MKLTYLAGFCMIAGSASATTVQLANTASGEPETLPVVDNTGNPLTSGVLAVGSYADGKDFSVFDDVLTGFTQFSSSTAFSSTFVNSGGLFNGVEFSQDSSTTGDFTADGGLPIYVVIGNGDTLDSSSQLAVWLSGVTFQADSDTGLEGNSPAFVRNNAADGSLLVGSLEGEITVNITGPGDITFSNSIMLAPPIPEPSTSLLAGLAGLCLAIRRRR